MAQNRAYSLGERHVQRARLAQTGPANTAHLPLQFYFHIISISKSLLATLAFCSDKRRVREGVDGWRKKGRVEYRRERSVYCTVHVDAASHIVAFEGTRSELCCHVLAFRFGFFDYQCLPATLSTPDGEISRGLFCVMTLQFFAFHMSFDPESFLH